MKLHQQEKNDLGEVRIHNEVIVAIARRATVEVDGVVRISGGFKRGFLTIFGKRKFSRGISIVKSDENELKIYISVIVRYGVNIPELTNDVQLNVKKSLEKIAGIIPTEINVEVDGIESEEGKIEALGNINKEVE
jgi:uncharacterized alkaline shock family protein YloU